MLAGTPAQLEARKRPRADQVHDGAIDEGEREVRGRDHREESEQDEGAGAHAEGVPGQEGEGEEEAGHDGDGRQVARRRAGQERAKKPLPRRRAVADLGFQEGAPLASR